MATLWMNTTQPEIKQTLFQTSNPIIDIDEKKIIVCFIKKRDYIYKTLTVFFFVY